MTAYMTVSQVFKVTFELKVETIHKSNVVLIRNISPPYSCFEILDLGLECDSDIDVDVDVNISRWWTY